MKYRDFSKKSNSITVLNSENTIFDYSLFGATFFLNLNSLLILGKNRQKVKDVVYLSEIM